MVRRTHCLPSHNAPALQIRQEWMVRPAPLVQQQPQGRLGIGMLKNAFSMLSACQSMSHQRLMRWLGMAGSQAGAWRHPHCDCCSAAFSPPACSTP